VTNLDDTDFESTLFNGLDGLHRVIKDNLFTSGGREVTVYNTAQLCVTLEGSRTTSIDTREALAIMWGDDPVHPSRDCYQSLAEHLQSTIELQPESAASSSSERPLKRPRWLEAESSDTVASRDSSRGRGRGQNNRGSRGFRGQRRPRGFRGRH
jgi:hypothetical protein